MEISIDFYPEPDGKIQNLSLQLSNFLKIRWAVV